MLEIWKFEVPIGHGAVKVRMPKDASLMSFSHQSVQAFPDIHAFDRFYVWALVDPEADAELRELYRAETGKPIEAHHSTLRHVGTAQTANWSYVLTLFEVL